MWNFGSTFSSCRISNGHEAMKGIFFFFCFCGVCVRKESNSLSLVEDDLWWKVQVASICLLFSHLFGFSIRASKDPIPISNLILFFFLSFFPSFFRVHFLWILPLFFIAWQVSCEFYLSFESSFSVLKPSSNVVFYTKKKMKNQIQVLIND